MDRLTQAADSGRDDSAEFDADDAAVPIRVVIADDDALARRVVRDALQDAGLTVIAEAVNGREAIELARYYRPDVVVMDAIMPGIGGLEATQAITAGSSTIKVVVLTSSDDEELGLMSLRSGAVGFVSKSVALSALPRAVASAHRGEAVVSRRLTMRLVDAVRSAGRDGSGVRPVRSPLTSREWEVLDLMCDGGSTDDIADALVLSPETVRSHVKNILRKLGVGSRSDAIHEARRMRSAIVVGHLTAGGVSA